MTHLMVAMPAPVITAFNHGQRYRCKPQYPITSDSLISIEMGKFIHYLLL